MSKYDNRLIECQVFPCAGAHEVRAWQPRRGEAHLLIIKCLECSWEAVFFGSDIQRSLLQGADEPDEKLHCFSVGVTVNVNVGGSDGFDSDEWSRMLNG